MTLVLFPVDKDSMEQEIAEGKVKAHKDGKNIILDGTREEQNEYIQNNIRSVFSMNPIASARLIHEDEKEEKKSPSTPSCKQE